MYYLLCLFFLAAMQSQGQKWVYIEDTSIRYYHLIGSGIWCEGTLNQRGVFKADINDLEKALEAHKSKVERKGPFPPQIIRG